MSNSNQKPLQVDEQGEIKKIVQEPLDPSKTPSDGKVHIVIHGGKLGNVLDNTIILELPGGRVEIFPGDSGKTTVYHEAGSHNL